MLVVQSRVQFLGGGNFLIINQVPLHTTVYYHSPIVLICLKYCISHRLFAHDNDHMLYFTTGLGCSKLTTLLVNVSLKFQTYISNAPIFFVEKM